MIDKFAAIGVALMIVIGRLLCAAVVGFIATCSSKDTEVGISVTFVIDILITSIIATTIIFKYNLIGG